MSKVARKNFYSRSDIGDLLTAIWHTVESATPRRSRYRSAYYDALCAVAIAVHADGPMWEEVVNPMFAGVDETDYYEVENVDDVQRWTRGRLAPPKPAMEKLK